MDLSVSRMAFVISLMMLAPVFLVSGIASAYPSPDLQSTTIVGRIESIDDLESIESLFSASVIAVTSDWNPGTGLIESFATVLVDGCSLGDCVQGYQRLNYLGGEVDGVGLRVSHHPSFELGERIFLATEADGTTFAITEDGTEDEGFPLAGPKWSGQDVPIPYYYNPEDAQVGDPLDPLSALPTIQRAFESWSSPSKSFLVFDYAGETLGGVANDGRNIVSWGRIDGRSRVLAATLWWFDTNTNRLTEFDMIMDIQERWTMRDTSVNIDLESVVLHEAGHALGLGHTNASLVMNAVYQTGTVARILGEIDINVIREIYPATTYSFSTEPAGLELVIDGIVYTTPVAFEKWAPSSGHVIYALPAEFNGNTSRYGWSSWSDGGDETHSIIVDSVDQSLTAEFFIQHLISVSSNFGEITGAGWVDEGASTMIIVEPLHDNGEGTRHTFVSWSGDVVSSSPSIEVIVTAPVNLGTEWKTEYFLDIIDESGVVTGSGWYEPGDIVQLSAPLSSELVEGRSRLVFDGWLIGQVLPENPLRLEIDEPKVIEVVWGREHFLLIREGRGMVDTLSQWLEEGSSISISALMTVEDGNERTRLRFLGWTGSINSADQSIIITIDAFKTIEATWIDQYLVEIDPNQGELSSPLLPDAIEEKTAVWVDSGASLSLEAISPSNIVEKTSRQVFERWEGNLIEASPTVNIIIEEPMEIKVVWETEFFLELDDGGGELSRSSSWVEEGEVISISALSPTLIEENEHRLIFNGWNGIDSDSREIVLAMDSPKRIGAEWVSQYFISIDGNGLEIVGSSDWYTEGSELEITAEEFIIVEQLSERLRFISWSGSLESSDRELKLTVDSSEKIMAETVTQYYLQIISEQGIFLLENSPQLQGEGWYDADTTATLIDPEDSGFFVRSTFVGWSGDIKNENGDAAVLMDSPKSVEAIWDINYLPLALTSALAIIIVGIMIFVRKGRHQ
ncbi:MAG: matrixin family metalloprotease [Nitrososphaerales archaeon]